VEKSVQIDLSASLEVTDISMFGMMTFRHYRRLKVEMQSEKISLQRGGLDALITAL